MTDISKLGEFGLIRHLTQDIKPQNKSTLKGVGDDCAVLSYPDSQVLVTTDMLMEGVHFNLTYIDLKHLGYKSAMVNISDIFAMNGTPRQMIVSIALSKRFTVEDMEQFYAGLRMACDKWGVDIVGGDTTSSYTGLAISITCIGEAQADQVVYRNGAHDTDLICVSGDLGAAYMGLQLLEREKTVYYQQLEDLQKKINQAKAEGNEAQLKMLNSQRAALNDFQPDFAGKEYLLQRQLKPEVNVTTCALNGGEDYELLFTVPIGDHEKIEQLDDIKLIGHITRPELGLMLISRDNQEFDLRAQGWNPLK